MPFCVAGVALCDIPTCRKCQNWRMSRTKCSFCCAHVSCLESLVFLWRRRVYGGKLQNLRFPSRLSCRFRPRTRMLTRMLLVQMSKHMDMQSRRTLFCNSLFEQTCTHFPCYQSECGVESVECGVWSVK